MNASWDEVYLAEELGILAEDPEIDVAITGFELAEIDQIIDLGGIDPETEVEEDEIVPHLPNASQVVTKSGDIWLLGDHRLLCTDGLNRDAYLKLMENGSTCQGRELAQMVFTDPPYNVPIAGHVTGNVNTRHPEFAMASGEMSSEQFTGFLGTIFSHLAEYTEDGSIHYVCMDWRHQRELLEAAAAIYGTPKNLCVWVKDNGGMGSFYRSRHELVYVFKKGDLPHINNFELGQHGRYRTNVWNYRGVSSGSRQAREELSLHPTVKPVAMVADAILDCSKRGGIILDPFCGSGTILIACEKTGRKARAIEIDPLYCDRAVMRWQSFAHGEAVLAETGESFSEVCDKRRKEACLQTNMDEALSNEGKRRLERNSKEAGSRNGETGLVTVNPKFTKPSPWSAPLNSK
jgi:DNA modification methylase